MSDTATRTDGRPSLPPSFPLRLSPCRPSLHPLFLFLFLSLLSSLRFAIPILVSRLQENCPSSVSEPEKKKKPKKLINPKPQPTRRRRRRRRTIPIASSRLLAVFCFPPLPSSFFCFSTDLFFTRLDFFCGAERERKTEISKTKKKKARQITTTVTTTISRATRSKPNTTSSSSSSNSSWRFWCPSPPSSSSLFCGGGQHHQQRQRAKGRVFSLSLSQRACCASSWIWTRVVVVKNRNPP